MPNKFRTHRAAPGMWSNPFSRIEAEDIPSRVRVHNEDQLIARGKWVGLWVPVGATDSGVVACTCTKNTTENADRACLTCYGTKFAPGYRKFKHQTLFACSAQANTFTLTGVEVSTTKKVHLLALGAGETTGVIETPDYAYTNPLNLAWNVRIDAFLRAAGQTLVFEWSDDAGATWTPTGLTAPTAPAFGYTGAIAANLLIGTGNVRFRMTMTRTSAGDLSPTFEIVRVRRTMSENDNRLIKCSRRDFQSGDVLILRTWVMEQDSLDPSRGRLVDHNSDRAWTSPLDWFDTSLGPEVAVDRIEDQLGPHPFYQYSTGVQAQTRYVINQVSYNENFGRLTRQVWDDRRSQPGENYWLVF